MNFQEFKDQRLNWLEKELRHPGAPEDPHNHIDGLLPMLTYTKPKSILEIGSLRGISTEVFLLHGIQVTSVDPHLSPTYEKQFIDNCSYYPNLTMIKGLSPYAIKDIPSESFDMCYIDGNHDVPFFLKDLMECMRIVKKDGWLAGHDYDHPGVCNPIAGIFDKPDRVFGDMSWVVRNNASYIRTFSQSATS